MDLWHLFLNLHTQRDTVGFVRKHLRTIDLEAGKIITQVTNSTNLEDTGIWKKVLKSSSQNVVQISVCAFIFFLIRWFY